AKRRIAAKPGHTGADDRAQELLRGNCSVSQLARDEAVVARTATLGSGRIAEVREQGMAAARRRLGVLDHLPELALGDAPLRRIGDVDEETDLLGGVGCAEEQQAFGGKTVAAGAARLLIVTF